VVFLIFSKKLLPKELKEKYLLAENSFSKKEFHTLEIRLEFVFISGILRHFCALFVGNG